MNAIRLVAWTVLVALSCGAWAFADRATEKGELRSVGNQKRIDAELVVSAGLEDVWHAWTTNEGAETFFSRNTNVELAIGGPYEMLFNADAPRGEQGSEGCKVLSYVPMEILSFSWGAPPKFTHARKHHTWVVVRFEDLGSNKTKVRLTHLGWDGMKTAHPAHADEWDQVYEYFSKAWPYVLDNLKKRFDEGPRWRYDEEYRGHNERTAR